jgi:hypothetical protein
MRLFSKSNVATIAIVGGIVLASGTGGAVAGAMVTGAQIKDGTVTGKDIRDASIGRPDLTPAARGISGIKVLNATAAILSGNWEKVSATCPTGTKVVSAEGWLYSSRGAVQVEVAGTTAIAWSPIVESEDTVRVRVLCGIY